MAIFKNVKIVYSDTCVVEAKLIADLMIWQQVAKPEMVNNWNDCLLFSKGRNRPIVILGNDESLEGFHNFYKWFNEKGYWLC